MKYSEILARKCLKFEYSYFEKGCRKNVHATIPKGNMGYDQYAVPDDCSWRTYFCCFHAQACIISKKRPLFTKVVLQILFRICQSNGKKEIHEFRIWISSLKSTLRTDFSEVKYFFWFCVRLQKRNREFPIKRKLSRNVIRQVLFLAFLRAILL